MVKKIAVKHFKDIAIFNTISRLISVLFSLIISYSISQVLSNIASGIESKIILYLIAFLVFSTVYLLWNYVFSMKIAKKQSKESQRFNETLYLNILNGKETREANRQNADYIVLLKRDVDQITNYYVDILPAIIQATIGMIMYSIYFVFYLKVSIALLSIILLGLLQFIPPFIMKKYLIKNYIRAGESESEINQQIISGISGFFTIKMLNIHEWFMEQYKKRQDQFQKVGITASATSAIQTSMDNLLSLILQLGLALILGQLLLMKLIVFATGVQLFALSGNIYSYMKTIFSIQTSRRIKEEAISRVNEGIPFDYEEIGHSPIPQAKENKLTVKDITFTQNNMKLLEDINMELKGDGIWLLCGPNGAGKTTFFHILMGHILADAGSILFNDEVIQENQFAKCFSYCPQTPLLMHMTGDDILKLLPYELEPVYYYLDYFDVPSYLLTKPLNSLSGGERKKIMLSICLANEAPVLLLDEPEASLDRESIEKLIDCLVSSKKIILVISHVDILAEKCIGKVHIRDGTLVVDSIAQVI